MEINQVDRNISRYFFLAIIIIFGILLYYGLSQFFSAFLGAVIFYILSKPLMERLVKKERWNKTTSAIFVLLVTAIIIMIPIGIMTYLLIQKGKYYVANPELIVQSLRKIQFQVKEHYNISVLSEENIVKIKAYATSMISSVLNEGLNFFGSITMLYFFLYFMLININRLEASIVFFLPFKREKIELFGKELVALTFSNSVGVPAIAVAQGLCGYIGYRIAGVPEAGFWAVVTGFSSIVPLIGTALVWLPASLYLFIIHHTWQGTFLIIWGLVVLGLTDNVVRFVLAKRMADVHPIITVLGVLMGIRFFGITGLIFGPVLISFFIILLKIYYVEFQSRYPVIARKKNIPVRFNLPFLGHQTKRKKPPYASDRSNE